jgi:hypothetical protein
MQFNWSRTVFTGFFLLHFEKMFITRIFAVGMHRILFLPDIQTAGYPANPKAGYWISGKGRIPDIRPDTWLDNYIFGQISNKIYKTAL